MNRRDFIIQGSTAALGLYFTSCAPPNSNPKRSTNALSANDLEAIRRDLQKLINGPVMGAGEGGYLAAINIDNGRAVRSPLLVVAPLSTMDIANTIKYCRSKNLRLTTRSGGHSAAGYCLNSDGLVLDLARMNSIQANSQGDALSVGAGTRWIQVYNHVQQNLADRVGVGGGCAGVGVAGFVLGGGYSFISRSYGMGCDNVKALEFVSTEGEIYKLDGQLSDPHERELYWALRGAGGGNFGIIGNIELSLPQRRTPTMMMGGITFLFERAAEVLHFYNEWVSTLPPEMAVYGMIRRMPDPTRAREPRLSLSLTPVYNGLQSEGMKLLRPLLDLGPTNFEMFNMTLPQWENFMGMGTAINGRSAYIRSAVLGVQGLTPKVVGVLRQYMNEAPTKDSFIVWTHGGGKIRDRDNHRATSYAHRDAEFIFELKTIWDPKHLGQKDASISWAVEFFDQLEENALGAYANYIDPLLENWQQKYYRGSYERLVKVKSHWDPEGYFNFQQSIGSSFSPTRTQPLDLSPLDKT